MPTSEDPRYTSEQQAQDHRQARAYSRGMSIKAFAGIAGVAVVVLAVVVPIAYAIAKA